jgi:hypothetical protein
MQTYLYQSFPKNLTVRFLGALLFHPAPKAPTRPGRLTCSEWAIVPVIFSQLVGTEDVIAF